MQEFQDWLNTLQNWEPWGKLIGVLLLCVGCFRYVVWPAARYGKKMILMVHRASDLHPVMMTIAEQFQKNSGSSLRDAIDRIENGIALSNQRTRALCAYLDVAVFETDASGQYVFVSKDWCKLTGLGPEEAMGDGWINCVQAHDRDRVMDAWKRSVGEHREFALEYMIYANKGNETFQVVSRAFPSKRGTGPNDKIIGIVGILRRAEASK